MNQKILLDLTEGVTEFGYLLILETQNGKFIDFEDKDHKHRKDKNAFSPNDFIKHFKHKFVPKHKLEF